MSQTQGILDNRSIDFLILYQLYQLLFEILLEQLQNEYQRSDFQSFKNNAYQLSE